MNAWVCSPDLLLAEKVIRFGCTLRLAGGDHEHAIAQLEGPRCGHPFTGGQAAVDDNLVTEHRPALDLAQMRALFILPVRFDDKHLIAPRSLFQRIHRWWMRRS